MAIITERVGNIFSAPPGSILIHACNAQGVWGSGVAQAFKQEYPLAYKIYRAHCLQPPSKTKHPPSKTDLSTHQASLVGTTLLIPPHVPPIPTSTKTPASPPMNQKNDYNHNNHWIACLFTSQHYGQKRSPPEIILTHTARAVTSLQSQLSEQREWREQHREKVDAKVSENGVAEKPKPKLQEAEGEHGFKTLMGECYAVRINSGKFGVRWEDTKRVLEGGGVDMVVLRPEEVEGEEGVGGGGQEEGEERGVKVGETKKRKVSEWGEEGDGKRERR